jgi:curved DNA-binding protein CbpA
MSDHYNLLGVSPAASAEDIRRAFRREAKRCHPDLFADRPASERETHQRRFIQLAQAYQILNDPLQRQAYDRRLNGEGLNQARSNPGSRASSGSRHSAGPASGDGSRSNTRASGASRGESARPSAGPRRASSASEAGPARPAGSRTREARADRTQELRDILKEAERSLSKFGIDLRQPADVVLEELLDWARALYRDLVGAVKGSPRGEAATAGGARAAERERTDEAKPKPSAGAAHRSSPEMDAARLNELAVERELQELKRGANRRTSAKARSVDDELAELKRKHGR